MPSNRQRWFAWAAEGSWLIHCADCGGVIDLQGPIVDHHPSICPLCNVECVYLNWKGRELQVVLKNAPPAIVEVVRFMQAHLNEYEYVELMVALEELHDAF